MGGVFRNTQIDLSMWEIHFDSFRPEKEFLKPRTCTCYVLVCRHVTLVTIYVADSELFYFWGLDFFPPLQTDLVKFNQFRDVCWLLARHHGLSSLFILLGFYLLVDVLNKMFLLFSMGQIDAWIDTTSPNEVEFHQLVVWCVNWKLEDWNKSIHPNANDA